MIKGNKKQKQIFVEKIQEQGSRTQIQKRRNRNIFVFKLNVHNLITRVTISSMVL